MMINHGTNWGEHGFVEKCTNGVNCHSGRDPNSGTIEECFVLQSGKLFSDVRQ
jgi:hypothetical protein